MQIDEKTLTALLEKRAVTVESHKVTEAFLKEKKIPGFNELAKQLIAGKVKIKELGISNICRLHPPRKGHKRKGIKTPFTNGGALGSRGEKINELIMRMI